MNAKIFAKKDAIKSGILVTRHMHRDIYYSNDVEKISSIYKSPLHDYSL